MIQPIGYGINPPQSGNPTLDAIHALPDGSKQAILNAHTQILGQAQQPPPGIQTTPDTASVASPSLPHIAPPRPQVPTLGPAPTDVSANKQEYSRLTAPASPGVHDHTQTGLSGINQIHNPWARIPLQILDAVGSTFAPGITAALPGTQLHHNMLVEQQAAAVNTGENEANESQRRGLEAAQTGNALAQPELADERNQNTLLKTQLGDENNRNKLNEKTLNDEATQFGRFGLKRDESGQLQLDPNSEYAQNQDSVHSLRVSQQQLADAHAELARAQASKVPADIALARQKVAIASQNAATAAGRLGVTRDTFNANYEGTLPGGQEMPGLQHDENGRVISPKAAGATGAGKVTNATRSKAEQAQVILDSGNQLKKDIAKNRDLFGHLDSYWKQAENGSPIADPRAANLISQIQSYAALQPAFHGMRGGEVMKEFEKMIGGIPKDPDALMGAIDGIGTTANNMIDVGTGRRQVGAGEALAAGGGNSGMIQVQIPGQAPGWIHPSQKAAFLSRYPNGKVF